MFDLSTDRTIELPSRGVVALTPLQFSGERPSIYRVSDTRCVEEEIVRNSGCYMSRLVTTGACLIADVHLPAVAYCMQGFDVDINCDWVMITFPIFVKNVPVDLREEVWRAECQINTRFMKSSICKSPARLRTLSCSACLLLRDRFCSGRGLWRSEEGSSLATLAVRCASEGLCTLRYRPRARLVRSATRVTVFAERLQVKLTRRRVTIAFRDLVRVLIVQLWSVFMN
ncbi:unnamed protein product [Trichogramma brassicae]|uniref:Uncharacterized protein n=1 Tax=Trichogramma brassicae TaxID=86971 RepID=A0A6H5HTK9_9HYME|nr:unnamed protein product [Trichogramma brassicae]